ncbi:hypothetical protein Poli38472_000119 [Pythium oligandrum]|uniref:Regulator of microtubule dynamics protein 1 n=1 Tax=Pythium oligandrum TaxID=41045 RepID=A0A8K1FHS7_PYTOL|nr:hypothetical protein Poli38472_000119 [Pythium oligandrum]|eukprot:TMW60077.1 hypothetical protein Poli38472_000119 [Pythium oligandrum]
MLQFARLRSVAPRALRRLNRTPSVSARFASTLRSAQPLSSAPPSISAFASVLAVALSGSVAFSLAKMSESAEAIKAEERFYDHSYGRRQLYEDLKAAYQANSEDIGVMWRLSRAAYDVSNLKATPADEKKQLIYYAYDVIQKALEKTDEIAEVHNWYGIILSSVGDYEGTKVAISNSYKIKSHWEKAIELKPSKPTTYHLLGRWCMTISDLSWIERKAASVLFGSPPESSYDEALKYLLKCDELDPGSWKKNSMLITQVYYKQRNWALAKEWAQKTLDVPIKSEEDQTVHEEATALLKKL